MAVEVLDEFSVPALAAACDSAGACLLGDLVGDDAELVVMLCDDDRIRSLNRDYRGRDSATDVLSFPQEEDPEGDGPEQALAMVSPEEERLLGDVVISVETATRQATEGGWTLEEETVRLLLHGLLHLLGHDHVNGGAQELAMQGEEARLVEVLRAAGIACASEFDDAGPSDSSEKTP
jgi:probable rRNA maturation factor